MDIKTSNESIGLRIKELREKNGESQEDLAKALNFHQNNISKIEKGNSLTSQNLILIAQHYNVSLDYLCKGEGGTDLLDTLKKYISFRYTKMSYVFSSDDTKYTIPKICINKSLFDYIVQIENARIDDKIPEELKNKWIAIELEKFNSRLQTDDYNDNVYLIPVPEEIALGYPELIQQITTQRLF